MGPHMVSSTLFRALKRLSSPKGKVQGLFCPGGRRDIKGHFTVHTPEARELPRSVFHCCSTTVPFPSQLVEEHEHPFACRDSFVLFPAQDQEQASRAWKRSSRRPSTSGNKVPLTLSLEGSLVDKPCKCEAKGMGRYPAVYG